LKNKTKIFLIALFVCAIFNPYSIKLIANSINKIATSDGITISNDNIELTKSKGDLISDKEAKELKDSKLTGEEYNFNTTYYPYYGMLSDNEKKLYKQVYVHMLKVKDSFVPYIDVNITEVKRTFEAIYNDHPEIFWVDTTYTYKYTKDNKCVQIDLTYNDTALDLEKHKKIFNTEVNRIIKNAKKYKTNYEREKYVHDVLVTSIKYDKTATMNQSAYSALINKNTICAGYARAFQYILMKLGIPTYYVVGTSTVNHAWNMVKLDDGYYNVDLTWDNSDLTRYKYFNKTDSDFSSSHKRTGLSLGLPSCNAYTYRNIVNNKNVDKTSNIKTEIKVNLDDNTKNEPKTKKEVIIDEPPVDIEENTNTEEIVDPALEQDNEQIEDNNMGEENEE
jgi:hypothetical protein